MFMYLNKCLAATPSFMPFSDWESILQSMSHDVSPPLCCWTLEHDLECVMDNMLQVHDPTAGCLQMAGCQCYSCWLNGMVASNDLLQRPSCQCHNCWVTFNQQPLPTWHDGQPINIPDPRMPHHSAPRSSAHGS